MRWTNNEVVELFKLQREAIGRINWAHIASHFPGRDEEKCENKWRLRKKLRHFSELLRLCLNLDIRIMPAFLIATLRFGSDYNMHENIMCLLMLYNKQRHESKWCPNYTIFFKSAHWQIIAFNITSNRQILTHDYWKIIYGLNCFIWV